MFYAPRAVDCLVALLARGRLLVDSVTEAAATYGAGYTPRQMLSGISVEVARAIDSLDTRVSAAYAELVIDWLTHMRIAKGVTARTIETYCKGMTQFLVWLTGAGVALDGATVRDIENWQKYLYMERRQAGRTRRQQLTLVRQFFAWLKAYRGGNNPAEHVPSPKVSTLVPRKYTTLELKKIFATCQTDKLVDIRDYALMLFVYATGARREEAAMLSVDQLTMSERAGRVRFYGKGKKEREVSFDQPVVDALRHWLIEREKINVIDRNQIWCNVGGKKNNVGKLFTLRTVDGIFKRRCKKAGINHKTLHAMRSTFATDMYDNGNDIEIIQRLMGHKSIETTRGYIVISEKQQRARMSSKRLSEITGGKQNELPLWIKQKQQQLAHE